MGGKCMYICVYMWGLWENSDAERKKYGRRTVDERSSHGVIPLRI